MTQVIARANTACSPERAYALSQDYSLRAQWDPFSDSYRLANTSGNTKVGDHVWVRAKNGFSMTAEVITADPGRRVAMKMLEGPWFFRAFSGAWIFKAEGDGCCITYRYGFQIVRGLSWILAPVVYWIFRREAERRVAAFARFASRGAAA